MKFFGKNRCIIVLFFALVLLGAVSAYKWYAENRIERFSVQIQNERQEEIADEIRLHWNKYQQQMLRKGADVSAFISSSAFDTQLLFSNIALLSEDGVYTIDLVNQRGELVAWGGRVVRSSYDSLSFTDTSFSLVRQIGLLYGALACPIPNSSLYLFLYKKIQDDERCFVVADDASDVLKLAVRIDADPPDTTASMVVVPLTNLQGETIAYGYFQGATKESLLQQLDEAFTPFLLSLKALLLLCVGVLLWQWSTMLVSAWKRILLQLFILWGVRYGWILLHFPADVFQTSLFRPLLYASSFGNGLVDSLGNLLLSTITLVVSVFFVGKEVRKKDKDDDASISALLPRGRWIVLIAAIAFQFFLLRAFGATVRSFVFDSTIDFYDSTTFLPHWSWFLLGISLVLLSGILVYCLFLLLRVTVAGTFIQGKWRQWRRSIVLSFGASGMLVWYFLERTPPIPVWSWCIVFFLFLLSEWIVRERKLTLFGSSDSLWYVVIVLSAFFITIPVLAIHVWDKENRQLESVAKELAQPTDMWMNYLVQNGLGTALEYYRQEKSGRVKREFPSAYQIWKKTAVARHENNSALFLYDSAGNEQDRFVVGLSSYEEREVLREIFQGEEERVHVVTVRGVQSANYYYGAWSSLRDSVGNFYGTVAFIVSPSSMGGYGTIATLATKLPLSFFYLRDVGLAEYKEGKLVSLVGTARTAPPYLPPEMLSEFRTSTGSGKWHTQNIGEETLAAYYVPHYDDSTRITSLVVLPRQGSILLFQVLKLFLLYLLAGGVLFLFALVRCGAYKVLITSFRTRLFLGFALIAVVPLLLLALSSRKLATEMSRHLVTTVLYRDLETLERRLLSYIEDEDDFVNGIDDDFCKAVAAEYGIDFSIYREKYLQASSTPELYYSGIRNSRLDGIVYSKTTIQPTEIIVTESTWESAKSAEGYKAFLLDGKPVGVLNVSTFKQYPLLEIELTRRNVATLSLFTLVCIGILVATGILILRSTKPLRVLQDATLRIGAGDLTTRISLKAGNEFDDVIASFNTMVTELQKHREEAERVERERAWREMAKQVAHEIRNPLTPMRLSLQHLRQVFKDKLADRERILQEITDSLLEQIETLSRIASEFSTFARMPLQKYERVDLIEILQQSLQVFSAIENIQFESSFPAEKIEIVADREHLSRAFINIFKNAVQAMENGGKISIAVDETSTAYVVRITDTGHGIPPENLRRIFEPNFSTKTEGMGMGLAITRRIIEEAGGTISCTSTPGTGTTFTIYFPR